MNRPIRTRRPPRDLRIEVGELALCGGKAVRIAGVHSDEKIHVQTVGTNQFDWVSVGALSALELAPVERVIRHSSDSERADEANARAWVAALKRAADESGWRLSKAACHKLAEQFGVAIRTVRRRWRRYLENPSASAQLPCLPGPAPNSKRLPPVIESIIDGAIDEIYLSREQRKISTVHLRCRELAIQASLTPPSYGAVRARIKQRDPLHVAKKRRGFHEGVAVQAPAVRGLNVSRPLEVVQIDHALIDLIVVSHLTRQPVGRPWITVAIDVFTRCVVGYFLSFDTPNQTSVAHTLEHAIFPKHVWLQELSVKDVRYPMYGKMESVHWDNAKTFQAKGIITQCERYNIHIQPRPVRSPHYGAYIERYIGTMMGAVHLLPGTTFSNVKARGDYPSERKAMMSFQDLERWLALEILGKYHNTPHSGLSGQTPAKAWEQAWLGPRGQTRLPALIGDKREFVLGLLPYVTRRVGRMGIQINSLRYWDPAITPFINSGAEHRVHFSQRDLSRVYLYAADGFIDVPLLDRGQGVFSMWELREARSWLRRSGATSQGEEELFAAIAQQRTIEHSAAATSKAARRKVARMPPASTSKQADADYATPVVPLPSSAGDVT